MPAKQSIDQLISNISEFNLGLDIKSAFPDLCRKIVDFLSSLLGGQRGYIFLPDEKRCGLESINIKEIREILKAVYDGNPAILTTAIIEGRPRSIVCVPLSIGRDIIGSLYIDSSLSNLEFDERSLKAAELFSLQISGMLGHLLLKQNLSSVTREIKLVKDALEGELSRQESEIERLRLELGNRYKFKNIVGRSGVMQRIFLLIEGAATVNAPVLIKGEAGSGKEILAKSIHYNSSRKMAPFIFENCSHMAPDEMESVLFGHVRGAVRGSARDKVGAILVANKGTIFLDKIEFLKLETQKKLLRVIRDGTIRPLGQAKSVNVDVRLIAATNMDLESMVYAGTFLKDLYEDLKSFVIDVPPLRERSEDIPLLTDHFLKQIAEERGVLKQDISKEALSILVDYNWPGNVAELESEIRKLSIKSGNNILPENINENIKHPESTRSVVSLTALEGRSLHDAIGTLEVEMVREVLERTKWNKAKTAKILGISRTTLYEKIAQIKSEKKSA